MRLVTTPPTWRKLQGRTWPAEALSENDEFARAYTPYTHTLSLSLTLSVPLSLSLYIYISFSLSRSLALSLSLSFSEQWEGRTCPTEALSENDAFARAHTPTMVNH